MRATAAVKYSEALEQQVRLWRWMRAPSSSAFLREVLGDPSGTWKGVIADALAAAEPYYWTHDFCDLLNAAVNGVRWRSMPALTLRPDLLPTPAGFFWFEDLLALPPLRAPAEVGGLVQQHLAAVCWTGWRSPRLGEGTHVTIYGCVAPMGSTVLPLYHYTWIFGESQADAAQREVQERPPLEGRAENIQIALSYLAAGLALLTQRLLIAPRQPAERHARRRVVREGWAQDSLIRVVELRRRERGEPPEPAAGAAGPEAPEWSCRWVVRGHWRQQACGIRQRDRRPVWILPYVKGPDEKPLKAPKAAVYAVVR